MGRSSTHPSDYQGTMKMLDMGSTLTQTLKGCTEATVWRGSSPFEDKEGTHENRREKEEEYQPKYKRLLAIIHRHMAVCPELARELANS